MKHPKKIAGAGLVPAVFMILCLAACPNPKGPPPFVAVTGINGVPTAGTVGQGLSLSGTVEPINATNQTIAWNVKTDGGTGASITGNILSSAAAGTVVVTATIANGLGAGTPYVQDFNITINATGGGDSFVAVTGVSLNKTSLTLEIGGTETLVATVAPTDATNKNVTWASNDTAKATVSGSGVVSAVSVGTATITVTTADGNYTATCVVTVTIPAGYLSTHTLYGVSVPFRYVPDGSFQRDVAPANVSIITRGYWMAETEVTQELFHAVMGDNPSSFTSGADASEAQNKRPVENVNWYAAIAFCNKLSKANGKEPAYSVRVSGTEVDWAGLSYGDIPTGDDSDWNAAAWDKTKNGYRLPTEMEWMWAAMGADKSAQPNITGYAKAFAGSDGSNSINDYAWNNTNSGYITHEVGKKRANELGLRDMSGNVYEWCWDRYDGTYLSEELRDYDGADSGASRMVRGSSWGNEAFGCAVALRLTNSPDDRYGDLGFRVVCP
jgi:formylglycine-generating enzyme required for sulfatase activity